MIGILDLRMGNMTSVGNAVYEVGADPVWIENLDQLDDVSHLILPGVGHYSKAVTSLETIGSSARLMEIINSRQMPVLGVCLGMQLMAESSEEGGGKGLGVVPGKCQLLDGENIRLPHVGWNQVVLEREHPVLEDIKPDRDFYFVHSYALTDVSQPWVIGVSVHGQTFASIIAKDSYIGVQFHPEKSQANGLKIIENFCDWDGQW